MNVVLPENKKAYKKLWLSYIIIIIVCIISLIVAFYIQFYGRIDIFGTKDLGTFGIKNDDELVELEEGFSAIFTNKINNEESEYNSKKIDADKPLVYTNYNKQESKENGYSIDVTIPYINVDSDIIQTFNEHIERNFTDKSKEILSNTNKNDIFQISYVATVEEGILSIIIQSTLKEGSNAQRLIIKTYNYDLRNNKRISLEEILRIKKVNTDDVQSKINEKIENEHKKAQSLISIGYPVLDRDITSNIYKVENTKEFYLSNNALYIIYSYGNSKTTNEMDLIIL